MRGYALINRNRIFCPIWGVIAIIYAVKDILLQISAACTFLFLFQWRLDHGHPVHRNNKFPDDQTFLMICCALSITLCMALSTTLFGMVYLNLAILPAYIGILYGNLRSGAYLALYFFLCTGLFSMPSGLDQLLLNTGVLMYPLLPAISLKCSISGLRPPLDSPGPASVTSSCPHSSATRFDTVALLSPVISDTFARDTGDCVRMVCRIIDLLIFLTSA